MEYKGFSGLKKADKTVSEMTSEQVAAKSQDASATAPKEEDSSADELKKLLAASGEGIGREGGDLGLKDGCVPKRNVVKEAATQTNSGLFRRGWGGGGAPPPPPMIETTFIDASACVSDMLKSEPLSLCQLKTSSGALVECVRWSRIGGEEKKTSQADCQQKADILSGVGTSPIREGALPKKEFFFICQKN
jgi:hypothetical protein